MKKLTILILSIVILSLAGCGNSKKTIDGSQDNAASAVSTDGAAPIFPNTDRPTMQKNADDVVEINEKLFIAQLNDIYLNENDYLGQTIKYEGIFTQYTWEDRGVTYYQVYRKSPGCCGADGEAGFEVVWPEGAEKAYPNENDWCEVIGTLEAYDEEGQSYLHIRLDSLTVKQERGAEFVSQ